MSEEFTEAAFAVELRSAVRVDDAKRVQELLRNGANSETPNFEGWRALHFAARHDASASVKVLIQAGADIEASDLEGWRPLHCAAKHNASAAIQALINARANVEVADSEDWRPLHRAAKHDASAALKALINAGANIEVPDDGGWRPLHRAAKHDASAAMHGLINAGADVEAIDYEGWRPLHRAAKCDSPAAVKALTSLGKADVEAPGYDSWRPVHHAAIDDSSAALQALIGAGADVDSSISGKRIRLESLSWHMAICLATNASNGDSSRRGLTPLIVAAVHGSVKVIKDLIGAGANVNCTDGLGQSPLHVAAALDKPDVALLLLEAGADPQLQDDSGKTPWQWANQKEHVAVAGVLEEAAQRCPHSEPAQLSPEKEEENVCDGASSKARMPLSMSSVQGRPPVLAEHTGHPSAEQPQLDLHAKALSKETSKSSVEEPLQDVPIGIGDRDSKPFDSDTSSTTVEVTEQVRAVQDLEEGDIFHEDYQMEAKPIFGKRLVRLAKGLLTNEDVVLKFYEEPTLYAKALSSYKRLRKSDYVCKPIERINSHLGFLDCLAFQKGMHTLEEWLRIPDISLASKRDVLQQVAYALCDVHGHGVVHSDVKPANIAFFPAEHRWKLLDIDSALDEGVPGDIITTISYASPEVLTAVKEGKTELALQPSADMWAYGIIAFEVFTGERFYGFEPTIESILEFARSERFQWRLHSIQERKQRHFVGKFLKLNASTRQCAREACTSSMFEPATVTLSKSIASIP